MFFREFTILNWLIGRPIPEGVIMDMFYVRLWAAYGTTAIVFLSVILFKFIKNNSIKNSYLFSIILALLVGSFFESFLMTPSILTPLFWLLLYKGSYCKNGIMTYKSSKSYNIRCEQKKWSESVVA
jgi:hypothetical protein